MENEPAVLDTDALSELRVADERLIVTGSPGLVPLSPLPPPYHPDRQSSRSDKPPPAPGCR